MERLIRKRVFLAGVEVDPSTLTKDERDYVAIGCSYYVCYRTSCAKVNKQFNYPGKKKKCPYCGAGCKPVGSTLPTNYVVVP